LRVLEALRWGKEVEEAFFAAGCRELPPVERDYYLRRPLPFDPERTRHGLAALEHDVERRLGQDHPAGRLLLSRCRQARGVIDLLEARGTRRFAAVSARLHGSSRDALPAGAPRLADLARSLGQLVAGLDDDAELCREEKTLDAETAAHLLSGRLAAYFAGGPAVKVLVTPALDATAAVGGDCLKVRQDARFSPRDVRLLEVHEGWVHLGTSHNARRQAACPFLARPLPEATRTQEGLAVWTEVLAFASHPARLRLLAGRVEAVGLAEAGADFLDVFRYFAGHGLTPRESYQQAARVFRGSLPAGGPFTKDLAYAHGFAEVGHFLQEAVRSRRTRLVPLLFAGKVSVADLPDLDELATAGLVERPALLPPPFADLRALVAWLCCAGCLRPPAGLRPAGS
jgi:uncharacterized protein (TIGR02421 family)